MDQKQDRLRFGPGGFVREPIERQGHKEYVWPSDPVEGNKLASPVVGVSILGPDKSVSAKADGALFWNSTLLLEQEQREREEYLAALKREPYVPPTFPGGELRNWCKHQKSRLLARIDRALLV